MFVDLQRKRIVIVLSYDHPYNDCNPAPDVSQGSRTQIVFPTSSSWIKPKPQPTDLQIKIWQKYVITALVNLPIGQNILTPDW